MKPEDRRFAKDVAKHIDRRRIRRRLLVYAAIITAIVLAVLYLRCGGGWGLGKGDGSGTGPGTGSTTPADAAPRRCSIRLAATGITVDGAKATRAQAVATCKAAGGADVLVVGDARRGDWEDLEAALDAAGVPTFRR